MSMRRGGTPARYHRTTPPTIDDLLLQARSGLTRLDPVLALCAMQDGAADPARPGARRAWPQASSRATTATSNFSGGSASLLTSTIDDAGRSLPPYAAFLTSWAAEASSILVT